MLLSAAVQQICRRGGGGGGGVSPVKVKIGRAIINSPSKSSNHCQISFAGLRCVRQPWHQQRLARSPRPLQMLLILLNSFNGEEKRVSDEVGNVQYFYFYSYLM